MNQHFEKKIVIIVGLVVLAGSSFLLGQHTRPVSGYAQPALKIDVSSISDKDFAPFWKVWNALEEKYVGATSTPNQEKIYGAMQGLVNSLGDPYTVFFPPEESEMFASDIAGSFGGVGMEVGKKDNVLTVIAPLKGSPAEKAGMKTGDRIVKIDDTVTNEMSVDKAVKLIRGPAGTKVRLTVVPAGANSPIERTITRDTISMPTIETEVKPGTVVGQGTTASPSSTGLRSDGVFVIRLFSFTATSPNLFRDALRDFIKSGSHKLVLDLRGNPGGYLEAAVDMASWFLPSGKVIVTEDFGKNSPPRAYRSKGYNVFGEKLQMVILVDGGSASASEILAGALKEHGVARLVGTKTFGKGSVQELIKITPDTSLKVTIARWLTPNGINLSKNGLDPDVEVKVTQADIDAKKDTQMLKAVEILNALP
ncbi:MAG: S41 family peptidase [Candidatus Pacebacteria bacterium]|nr:S41 family peptidase [Candidatus Paceibacterota bacterium]